MYETGVSYVHATTKGKGVTICMVDTPIDIFHPSLSSALIETLDHQFKLHWRQRCAC